MFVGENWRKDLASATTLMTHHFMIAKIQKLSHTQFVFYSNKYYGGESHFLNFNSITTK